MPTVSFTVIVSIALLPPAPLVWRELLKFTPFFLRRSLQGGANVAWWTFHLSMPIAPERIDFPLRLPLGLLRVILVNTVSLLPDTLSAELHGQAKIHVLDSLGDYIIEEGPGTKRDAHVWRVADNFPRR